MTETKPKKRLVSKRQYVYLRGQRVAWDYLGCFLMVCAVPFVVSALFFGAVFAGFLLPDNHEIWTFSLLGILLSGSIAYALFWCAREAFYRAKSIEVVEPITEKNAHLLPAEVTLLRGSDLPPTVARAELLRATQAKQETSKEQLLRATSGDESP